MALSVKSCVCRGEGPDPEAETLPQMHASFGALPFQRIGFHHYSRSRRSESAGLFAGRWAGRMPEEQEAHVGEKRHASPGPPAAAAPAQPTFSVNASPHGRHA